MPSDLPTFADCFADLPDPRNVEPCDHLLLDILFIAVCAVICGADGFTDMEEFGIAKQAWLRQFLELPNGIPSHNTFNPVFQRLRAKELQAGLLKWIHSVAALNDGDIVAIDGKTLRRSHQRGKGKEPLELVSAWARRAGLLDWDAIIDGTRNLVSNPHWDPPSDIIGNAAKSYRQDLWADQKYRPFVMIEKAALIGVIENVCTELYVPYLSCRGYMSDAEIYAQAQRCKA